MTRISFSSPLWRRTLCAASVLLCCLSVVPSGMAAAPYTQHKDVVYGQVHGVGLLMDVFVPTGRKNGRGIVDVASGAWHSDRGKIRDHQRAMVFNILCLKGYTVFAVRPGSVSRFGAQDMLSNLNRGIRWTKAHAKTYHIDPNQLGLMGASAGGHLACLQAVTSGRRTNPDKTTRIKAIAAFFPPTDFLDYGGRRIDFNGTGRIERRLRQLIVSDRGRKYTKEELEQMAKAISPARLVTKDAPPFLLIHGDADPLVPLQQSQRMVAALKAKGVPVKLIVKPGGGHPWLTIPVEVMKLADWFDTQLQPAKSD